jgi:ATP-dependent exoDNAse (exonuclease V) alpha subunit/predicted DNA-binding protein YlxM (UPF0122 family)
MDQNKALAILKSGQNVFLTGSAGTGKTHILNQYIKYLKERKVPVAVTASTGIAATHMNGMTIHAWSGIGIKNALSNSDLQNLQSKKYLTKNLEGVQVLIIDEISMLHKNQLDMVDKILRYFREPDLAFGGIQIVLSGDFFQLPPVGNYGENNRDKFAFMAPAWLEAKLSICYLTKQFRQEDNSLNKILKEIRLGQVSPEAHNNLINSKKNAISTDLQPTKMYTHNMDVDRINREHLIDLPGKIKNYRAVTKGNKKLIEGLIKSVLTEEDLQLKEGAKVMFIKNNYEKGYVNGTTGTIVGFSDDDFPIVKTLAGKTIYTEPETWSIDNDRGSALASFTQLPLRLAWAVTVHKSQGMTLDAAEIDLSKTFEKGQGYVALSRLKSLDGLLLKGFNPVALQVDPLAAKADKRFQELSADAENALLTKKESEKQAIDFIKKCGGLTDTKEIEREGKKAKEKKASKKSTHLISKEYIEKGLSLDEIAEERGLTRGTIIGHLPKIKEKFPETDLARFRPAEDIMTQLIAVKEKLISENNQENFQRDGSLTMRAFFAALDGSLSYEDIKLGMAFLE